MESHSFDIVENVEQMSLDGVRVACLSKNFQEGRVRNEEKTRELQSLLFQISDQMLKSNDNSKTQQLAFLKKMP